MASKKRKRNEDDGTRILKARKEETSSSSHLELNNSSEKRYCTGCGQKFINSEAFNFHVLNKKSKILKLKLL